MDEIAHRKLHEDEEKWEELNRQLRRLTGGS
jgi:hypothetical protein